MAVTAGFSAFRARPWAGLTASGARASPLSIQLFRSLSADDDAPSSFSLP